MSEMISLVCKTDYDPNALPFGDRNFYALLSFKFNGETIEWDEYYMEELADAIDNTYAGEGRYNILNNQTIEIEIYDGYDDELKEYVGLSGHNTESRELIKEHIRDAKSIFARQLFAKIDYANDMYEDSLLENIEDDELFDLYLWANDKISAKEFADKQGYEWDL